MAEPTDWSKAFYIVVFFVGETLVLGAALSGGEGTGAPVIVGNLLLLGVMTAGSVWAYRSAVRHQPAAEGPIQWVEADNGLWMLRLTLLASSLGLMVLAMTALFAAFLAESTSPFLVYVIAVVAALLAAVGASVLTGRAPTNRRIGLASNVLLVDVGFRTLRYPWEDLGWLSENRLTVTSGVWEIHARSPYLRLTPEQSEAVRRFAARAGEAAEGSTHDPPRELPPWVTVYDPR
jgi:hypothetical protein